MCVLNDVHVYLLSAPVFLDNLVVFSLCAEKCWRSEKPNGGSKKKGEESEECFYLISTQFTTYHKAT